MTQFNPKQISILRTLIKDTAEAIDFSPYTNSRVLISGASGHLGVWLTLVFAYERSLNSEFQLVIESSRHKRVADLISHLEIGSVDLLGDSAQPKFDFVFDMTLPNSPNSISENYSQMWGFLKQFFVQKSRVHRGGTLVIPSSGAVYGSRENHNFSFVESEAIRAKNRTPYGKAKFLIEKLSAGFDNYSLPIFRIFSVFGPLMRTDSPLIGNSFFAQCSKSREIRLLGDGIAQRNMTFVTDIAKQIITLAKVDGISNSPINLGSDNNLSVKAFANLVAQQMDARVTPGRSIERPDHYIPNLNRLNEIFVSPNIGIRDAIRLTSGFY